MRRESGQVLLTGIVMMLIILLAILLIFDLHSAIRSKLKLGTAQQAAALAAAEWQKESLNLIGEINLLKACEVMLETEDAWGTVGYSETEDAEEDRRFLLRARVGLLTEMQTRISFMGPLIGFAAAQQAAKRNGLSARGNSREYVELLQESWRYREEYGGAPDLINNFRWREPYTQLVSEIVDRGIAVNPNARLANAPATDPTELGKNGLYEEILQHKEEIEDELPVSDHSSWKGSIYEFVKNWRDSDFADKWWHIDFSMSRFPRESEIYTLGVEYASGDYDISQVEIDRLLGAGNDAYQVDELPAQVSFCRFDRFWYPSYYSDTYSSYDEGHYNWWFKGELLRNPFKGKYIYEGPASYAEGAVEFDTLSRYRLSGGRRSLALDRRIAKKTYNPRRVVGAQRGSASDSTPTSTDVRPGAIAKVLGELDQEQPPIALPVILPVFDKTALMPTYMPIPYGFGVLRIGNSMLDRFLNWLAVQDSLTEHTTSPPEGTELYLLALQTLTDGAGFRYYGFNPSWSASSFDSRYASRAVELFKNMDSIAYHKGSNSGGAGWLQLPNRFYVSTQAEVGVREVTDYINGGTAQRIFNPAIATEYIVIDSTGHIVTNDESDPTVRRVTGGRPGGNGNDYGGQDGTDSRPGPPGP